MGNTGNNAHENWVNTHLLSIQPNDARKPKSAKRETQDTLSSGSFVMRKECITNCEWKKSENREFNLWKLG